MSDNRTAEQILRKSFDKHVKNIYGNRVSFDMQKGKTGKNFDWTYEAMEEYASQQTASLREENERLEQENIGLKYKITLYEEADDEWNKIVRRKKDNIKQLQEENERLKANNDSLEDRVDGLNNRYADAVTVAEKQHTAIKQLQEEVERLKGELEKKQNPFSIPALHTLIHDTNGTTATIIRYVDSFKKVGAEVNDSRLFVINEYVKTIRNHVDKFYNEVKALSSKESKPS